MSKPEAHISIKVRGGEGNLGKAMFWKLDLNSFDNRFAHDILC